MVDGSLAFLKELMGQVFSMRILSVMIPSPAYSHSRWVIGREWDSGQTNGAARFHCNICFLLVSA